MEMLDFVPIWATILGLGVFMYVLLDGFDLGVGILFRAAPADRDRDLMMNSVAPIWDGNETWLILGGAGLLAAFPIAFSIIIPALYFPVLMMLIGLMFRGVAFEFRAMPGARRAVWDRAFQFGSIVATFAQGVILGSFVGGFAVNGRQFAGGSFDWLHPFPLLTGVGLMAGYSLLGACWLVLKTEGGLQEWARGWARILLLGVLAFIAVVSLWTPIHEPSVAHRWFSFPAILYLWPVPLVTLALGYGLWRSLDLRQEVTPFLAAMGLFVMCYVGLAISVWPMVVPYHISLWEAAASPRSQAFLLVGTLFLLPIILFYTGWSYWVFRGKVRADVGYH